MLKSCHDAQEVLYSLILNYDVMVVLTSPLETSPVGSRLKKLDLWLEVWFNFELPIVKRASMETRQVVQKNLEALVKGERCDVGEKHTNVHSSKLVQLI